MDRESKNVRLLDKQIVEVTLPNKPGYERIAMECSAAFAKLLGFKQERIEDVKTAISEACLNAMKHGNKGRPYARVIVTLDFKNGALSISVMDEGNGIPEIPKDYDIEQKIKEFEPPRGHGIYLIKQLVDQVDFNEKTDEGHVVRMVIKLSQ